MVEQDTIPSESCVMFTVNLSAFSQVVSVVTISEISLKVIERQIGMPRCLNSRKELGGEGLDFLCMLSSCGVSLITERLLVSQIDDFSGSKKYLVRRSQSSLGILCYKDILARNPDWEIP